MTILRLDIHNLRNIHQQTILPSPNFNFIFGENGSGKSALLEAIFILGRAKSFRTTSIKSAIAFNEQKLIVSAQTLFNNTNYSSLGIQVAGSKFDIHINQENIIKRSDLVNHLPLQVIHPKSFDLLDSPSQNRREFIDWGVFNDKAEFLPIWRKYRKALAQRNVLLKTKQTQQINVWNQEISNYGGFVNNFRIDYLNKLTPVLNKVISFFVNLQGVEFKFLPGWDSSQQLEIILKEDLEKDLRLGFTHSGPHRCDFHLLIEKRLAKEVASRGQLKLIVISLKLAQVELILNERNFFGCILIDDFSAELDRNNRSKVLQYLQNLSCQTFITSTEKVDFNDLRFIENYKMFHVEQGKFSTHNVPCET